MSDQKGKDFNVEVLSSRLDENTLLLTSASTGGVFDPEEASTRILMSAMQSYETGGQLYSTVLSDGSSSNEVTLEQLNTYAQSINTDINTVLTVNALVRKLIALDDVFGCTYNAVQANINTGYKLSFNKPEGRNKLKQLNNAQALVEAFNERVRLKRIINDSIMQTFSEGTCILCLRLDNNGATIDMYPLGVARISDYSINSDPVVEINMTELKSRIRKTYSKDKKNKAIYFQNIEEDIKNNYPDEVYQAYLANESVVRLNHAYTGVLRINNFGRKYGASTFFRALRPAVVLDSIESADVVNNKSKAKKIIHQKLRKELLGPDGTRKCFEYAIHAHNELAKAWRSSTVLYTSIPAVESVEYVESSVEGTPVDKIALYRNQKMTALGIAFADPDISNYSVANISLTQLMKTIDAIADQLAEVIQKFYKALFEYNGFDLAFVPTISILDSAQADLNIKKDLVELLYSKLNCSYETAFSIVGIDVDDEASRRIRENNEHLDEVFTPRKTAYTVGNDDGSEGGRPSADPTETDPDKQAFDKNYNDTARK